MPSVKAQIQDVTAEDQKQLPVPVGEYSKPSWISPNEVLQ